MTDRFEDVSDRSGLNHTQPVESIPTFLPPLTTGLYPVSRPRRARLGKCHRAVDRAEAGSQENLHVDADHRHSGLSEAERKLNFQFFSRPVPRPEDPHFVPAWSGLDNVLVNIFEPPAIVLRDCLSTQRRASSGIVGAANSGSGEFSYFQTQPRHDVESTGTMLSAPKSSCDQRRSVEMVDFGLRLGYGAVDNRTRQFSRVIEYGSLFFPGRRTASTLRPTPPFSFEPPGVTLFPGRRSTHSERFNMFSTSDRLRCWPMRERCRPRERFASIIYSVGRRRMALEEQEQAAHWTYDMRTGSRKTASQRTTISSYTFDRVSARLDRLPECRQRSRSTSSCRRLPNRPE